MTTSSSNDVVATDAQPAGDSHPARLLVGLFSSLVILGAFKAATLAAPLESVAVRNALGLVVRDLSFLLFGFALAQGAVLPRASRRTSILLGATATLLVLFYVFDLCLIRSLNVRLRWADAWRFVSEARFVLPFVSVRSLIASGALVVISVLTKRVGAGVASRIVKGALLLSALLTVLPFGRSNLDRYRLTIPDFLSTLRPPSFAVERYSPVEILKAGDELGPQRKIDLPKPGANVILLLSESLSAVDSKLLGGIRDSVPALDALAPKGMVLTNYLTNFPDTEGALVSVLTQAPPIPFPGSDCNLYSSFQTDENLVNGFEALGYRTQFLTNGPLAFLKKGDWLRRLGFDLVEGRDEVARFRKAKLYAFLSPSDKELYDEALERVKVLQRNPQPFFLNLLNVSAHTPWVDPEGKGDNEQRVWQYVSEQIASFVTRLEETGFFENGTLIIAGDHTKMIRLGPAEEKRYGASAIARVYGLMIGAGVPPNTVNRTPIDHARLFSSLGDLARQQQRYNPAIVFVLRGFVTREDPLHGSIDVFDPRDLARNYTAQVSGTSIVWDRPEPAQKTVFEKVIHTYRAHAQGEHARGRATCPTNIDANFSPGTEEGLAVDVFRGPKIEEDLSSESPRFVKRTTSPNLWFVNGQELAGLNDSYTLRFQGFFRAPKRGYYQFWITADDGVCFGMDGELIVDQNRAQTMHSGAERQIFLEEGVHALDVRYFQQGGASSLKLEWRNPETAIREAVPKELFLQPAG